MLKLEAHEDPGLWLPFRVIYKMNKERNEFGQTPGDSEGQESLACCCPWGCKEPDMTEQLKNNNEEGKLAKKELREWREEKQMRATERHTDRQTDRDWQGPMAVLFLPFPSQVLLWSLMHVCMHAKLIQWCPTLCDPMGCSPSGSSVHGDPLQARILEWVAISSTRGSSRHRD